MSTIRILAATAVFALTAGLAGAASAVTVIDFSFETPVQSGGSNAYTYDPTVTGALFTGGAGVQANGSAWGFAPAPDGVQTAFLQNDAQISLGVSGLTAGSAYTVTFDDSQRPNYGILPIEVRFDGVIILTTTPGSSWAPVTTASFTATNSTGTLAFITIGAGGDNDSGIDAVSFASAVPEPAAWALMLVGFGGLGAVARSRRSATLAV